MALRFPVGMCRRCHPVRFLRYGLLFVFAGIVLMTAWQYFFSSSPKQLSHVDFKHRSKDAVDSIMEYEDHLQWTKNTRKSNSRLNRKTPDRASHDRQVANRAERKYSTQSQLDYIGSHLDIRYTIVGNEGGRYFIDLTLHNKGKGSIDSCCWSIYFYHTKFLDTYSFNSGTPMRMMNELNQESLGDVIFTLMHVNGYTFRLQPTNRFEGLESGERVVLRIGGGGWAISRSEVIPNWYVSNDYSPSAPRFIESTVGEDLKFVADFDMSKRWSRSDDDMCVPFTPEDRYSRNKVRDFGVAPNNILPTPLSVQLKSDGQQLELSGQDWTLQYVSGLENEAKFIQTKLNISSLNLADIPRSTGKAQCLTNAVTLHLSDNMPKTVGDSLKTSEKYVLVVGARKNCISIFAPSATGVFYGIVSLLSLLTPDSTGKQTAPGVVIVDAPRYPYRGVMVDVVRHFHTKEELLRLMEVMAMYKLNKLHLHLADDEGWRLEIPELPELTTFGSLRGHQLREKTNLMSLLGSGPFTNSSGSGFYSVGEYRALLKFARSRHIQIIPEFDMPGHSHAAIKSMEIRYAHLKGKGDEAEAMKYLLSDLADRSAYMSGQFYKDSAINPCIESSYRFVEHVVKEVVKMHKNISPLKLFHFGGDEVPQDAYTNSPACFEFLRSHKKLTNAKDLKTYFVRRVALIIARHGLSSMGWEDAFSMSNGQPIGTEELGASDVVSQAWYNIWESGLAHRAYQYANAGYKVVLSPTTNFYYDNPQEPDPEDWGLHWATRYVSTKRSFNFMPDSMYDSIDFDFWGKPITKADLCDLGRILCEPLRATDNILGIEGVMWSELIRTADRMDWMLWPRLIALAERSWHKANWESVTSSTQRTIDRKDDWANFANIVGYKELRRLEAAGVKYYMPRPGARVRNGKLWVNTAFPGLVVQVSVDGGQSWNDYDINSSYKGDILLATRSFDWSRRSVPVAVSVNRRP